MSQENVEVAERVVDGFSRCGRAAHDEAFARDFELLRAMIEVVGGSRMRDGMVEVRGYQAFSSALEALEQLG